MEPVVVLLQVYRLARIVSLLKKNCCPTTDIILLEYEKLEYEENQTIRAKYSLPTVYCDIDVLKNEFGCPIQYDRIRKHYYLTDCNWEFNCPAQLSSAMNSSPPGNISPIYAPEWRRTGQKVNRLEDRREQDLIKGLCSPALLSAGCQELWR